MAADIQAERERRMTRGVLTVVLVACVGLLLGVGSIVGLRWWDKPPQLLTVDQLRQLSLVGTWRDKSGAAIRFAPWSDPDPYTGGEFTFIDVPNVFDYRTVPNPPSNGHGYWTIDGQTAGTVFFTFQGGGWPAGSEPKVSLLVEGSPSSPTLLCRYPDNDDTCTFTKQ